MDKEIHELGSEVRDHKATILLEKVKEYDVKKPIPHYDGRYEYLLHFLNKVSITYKNGRDVTEEQVNGIQIVTVTNRNNEEEVFFIKFKTESGKTIDLNFMYESDVDKIINSL